LSVGAYYAESFLSFGVEQSFMRNPRFTIVVALIVIFLAPCHAFALDGATFIPLGDFPEGAFSSWADGISADGSIVVGTGTREIPPGNNGWGFEAFVWTLAGGLQGLGSSLGERGTGGSVISGDGNVVGGFIFEVFLVGLNLKVCTESRAAPV
jgi:uncharacterized membrane protein